MPLRLTLLALLGLLALGFAPAAHGQGAAPHDMEVGMEDERLLLSEPDKAPAAIAAWQAAGVDVVRIHARWFEVAPAQGRPRRPRGFYASRHVDRRYRWGSLDRAVALVRAAGMRVMLTITGPGPLWTSERPRRGKPRYYPSARAYGQFAGAVAARFAGAVDRYAIWNEPNQAGWLQPQSDCRGLGAARRCVLAAPHVYRDLVLAAVPAIRRADPGAQILAGELAPIGERRRSSGSPIAPLTFLRTFACVNHRYRPVRTGRCRGFRPPAMDALAYHPHGVRNGPQRTNPDPNSAQIADLPRLLRVIDRLTDGGHIRSPGGGALDVYLTEFSYQTKPPDPAVGISLFRQAVYQQQAAYLAWRLPRIRNLTQYQWEDELTRDKGPGTKRYAGWQGGLRFYDGTPKPSLAAYEAPFVADIADDGRSVRLWGQVRPGGAHEITVWRGAPGDGPLEPMALVPSSPAGTWTLAFEFDRPGRYAATWPGPDGSTVSSPVLSVRPDRGGRIVAGVLR